MYYALTELIESLARSVCNGVVVARTGRRRTRDGQLPKGVIVGTMFGDSERSGQPFAITEGERKRHTYVLGSTGAGKTNLLLKLIQADIVENRTFVVIDLRGDLIDRILALLAADSESATDRLCLVDLRQDEFVCGFNPLVGSGDLHSRALYVLDVLRSQAESWGVALDETLRNTLIALAESEMSLCETEPLLTNSSFRERILAGLNEPNAQSFFSLFHDLSYEKQTTLSMPVINKVTPFLAVPKVRRMLGSGVGIDVIKLLDTPGQILLVSLAVDRLHGAAHLVGGLLVSAIQHSAMARVDLPEKKRNPAHLYIDEFETMASESFSSIVAEGRRFGLSLTLSHQNLYQLSTGLRQVLRNNVGLQVFFQTGSLDASELSGEIVGLGSKDEVKTLLLSQGVGQAIFVRRGQPPVRVQTDKIDDPEATSKEVEELKYSGLTRFGRQAEDVETEIRGRLAKPQTKTEQIVRHDRAPAVRGGKKP
ncbi:MAG: type IV secretion system DNA-binding domain-containing protein [Fimbriimonadaceae bacterium]|nr:type IV secretion system DNA-binding domain-containing protein [Fimbriimonadaceae bacterium]